MSEPSSNASTLRVSSFRLLYFIAALNAVFLSTLPASADLGNAKINVRSGFFNYKFSGSGVEAKPFTDFMTLNIEYELFQSARHSHVLRTILAMDFASARLMYFNAGYGQRFYLGGSGLKFDRQEANVSVIAVPKLRYFVGFDVGIANAIVNPLTPAVQIASSVLDFGIDSGITYSIGKSMDLSVAGGASFGWGFSSVAVTGITMFLLVGVSHFF